MTAVRARSRVALVVFALAVAGAEAWAQDEHGAHAAASQAAPATPAWQWTVDSNAFLGFIYQHRNFRDVAAPGGRVVAVQFGLRTRF